MNVVREGLEQERVPEASCLVILGASGDLTMRKLIPGLYSLAHDGLLPTGQSIIGFARTEYSDDQFRQAMREACEKHARRPVDDAVWENFAKSLFYIEGSFDDPAAFQRVKERAEECDRTRGTGGRRIYYFAIAPSFFSVAAEMLNQAGMVNDPEQDGPYTRVIVEKPFGRDLPSATELNRVIVHVFRERQVFRIDHYLGKETVQNLLVLRFGNGIFEPFWNRQYIDHVQFTVAETVGVEKRGGYFETSGISRDIIQNHMLQLVSLVAMEPPVEFEANAVRDEKVKVLKALREFPQGCDDTIAVRGQYAAGSVLGEKSEAYRNEPNVNPKSRVDTYAAMKLFIDNWRWADVPFYVRAGKRMPKRVTDISIHFRSAPYPLFHKMQVKTNPNILAIRIQPDEGISLKFDSKVPGPSVKTAPVSMEFRYATSFGAEPPEAYERLLLDTMLGDSTLFARRDEVETAWEWIDPLLKCWESEDLREPHFYPAGTWGPDVADELLARDGRKWRRP
jgi:glucose-6-phosphate 1-dehydrogenase